MRRRYGKRCSTYGRPRRTTRRVSRARSRRRGVRRNRLRAGRIGFRL